MSRLSLAASLMSLFCLGSGLAVCAESPSDLRPPSAFASIADTEARSAALFTEAGKVIQSPRCQNCHPATRQPTQGDDLHPHVPYMQAGAENHGPKGMPCMSCHGPANAATLGSGIKSVPGNARWSLAPASMAWQGKSLGEICTQIRDPKRNGGLSFERLEEHMGKDDLVGWAWHPGGERKPAPGTQAEFGELIKAWIETGAHCPAS